MFLSILVIPVMGSYRRVREGHSTMAMWGVGSIAGILIYGFFTSYYVVGLMPYLVLILALQQTEAGTVTRKRPLAGVIPEQQRGGEVG